MNGQSIPDVHEKNFEDDLDNIVINLLNTHVPFLNNVLNQISEYHFLFILTETSVSLSLRRSVDGINQIYKLVPEINLGVNLTRHNVSPFQ